MTRHRLLLLAAFGALVLGACSQEPTSPSPAAPRFEGGNTLGSGNAVPTDSAQSSGN